MGGSGSGGSECVGRLLRPQEATRRRLRLARGESGRSGSEGPRLVFRVNLLFTGKTLGEKNNVFHANAFGGSNMFLLIIIEMQRCQLAFLKS